MSRIDTASPKKQAESSRQYDRLLRGEITPQQYVRSLRDEARSQVASQRLARAATVAAARRRVAA